MSFRWNDPALQLFFHPCARPIEYTISGKYQLEPPSPADVVHLSEGDRNALALAFFLAKMNYDIENSLSTDALKPILVFDDPVSSLDSDRRDETVDIITDLLIKDKISQAIVLSHDVNILTDLLASINKKQANTKPKIVTTAEFEIQIDSIRGSSSLV
jgi:wobble nucleotide-excising tRNase